jgi:hypothetical protein
MEKVLGKIEKVWYGLDGDGQFGLSLTLSFGRGGAVQTFKGGWADYSPSAKYSYDEWLKSHTGTALFILDTLKKAKKRNVADLAGVPIEAELDGNLLKSWRVLEEVL